MSKYNSKLKAVVSNGIITGIQSTVKENSIGAIAFAMDSTGNYLCTSDGLFNKETTEVCIDPTDGTSSPAFGIFFAYVLDTNTILINSLNVNTDDSVEAGFNNLTFKIKL